MYARTLTHLTLQADGYIDVWDFTDMSHKPAQTIAVGLARITCMEFYVSYVGP